MLLILAPEKTNRLTYICSLLLNDMLGTGVQFTTSGDEFASWCGPKICYGSEPAADGIFIRASGLLAEETIGLHDVPVTVVAGVPVLFHSGSAPADMQFDIFAAAFFMASRYEEYLPHKKDSFGRYPAGESVAWRGQFLDIPVVHTWAGMLKALLVNKYPGIEFVQHTYRYVPTIDIDHAWCYRGRTFERTLGGFGKSLIRGRLNEAGERFRVLAGIAPDPYDNYEFIRSIHEPSGIHPLYFILYADYGANDNNVTLTSKAFRALLRQLDQHGNVGIHPSLSSNKHLLKLEDEYDGLCDALNRRVTINRQHFLKLSLPRTYRSLIQLGIGHDYSMGYASHPGFRAGLAMPFPFFDLSRNEATALMIHPVSLMDVTMRDYLRLNRDESIETIRKVNQAVRDVQGEFVSLWHNESLGDRGRWAGWRTVYEALVKQASV